MKSGWLKGLSIFVLLIFIGIAGYMLYYFVGVYQEKSINKIILNNSNSISYNVKLANENNLVSNIVTNQFKSNEIEFLNVTYKYTNTFSNAVNGVYNYSVIGELKIFDENNKVIAFKQVFREDHKNNTITDNVINIGETFKIDYQKNNEYAKEIIKNNKYKNTKAYLYYRVIFNDRINSDKKNLITDSKTMEIYIPLVDEVINISKSDSDKLTTKLFTTENREDKIYYIVVLTELSCSILLFIIIIINILVSNRRSKKNLSLKKILHKYDDYIVNIKSLPDLEHYEIIFVKSFKDLLDMANMINSPINYVDLSANYESIFIVFAKDKVYVYKYKNIK